MPKASTEITDWISSQAGRRLLANHYRLAFVGLGDGEFLSMDVEDRRVALRPTGRAVYVEDESRGDRLLRHVATYALELPVCAALVGTFWAHAGKSIPFTFAWSRKSGDGPRAIFAAGVVDVTSLPSELSGRVEWPVAGRVTWTEIA